ncbi:MAG: acyltransferase family protein [Clostridium sp.]|nr:acyltransferase family protein [Prevotella sp.]MCM1429308.1 acyltransferase family protein [Clostridium sp.]MCM1475659.1 acyltransferase family protein [Muribaculaceae bacterium]
MESTTDIIQSTALCPATPRPRIVEFDIIKFLAIFLVLWGHSIKQLHGEGPANDYTTFRFINAFHMPLFMLISGFFFGTSHNIQAVKFFSKKFWRLLYPCLSFGILVVAVNLFSYGIKGQEISPGSGIKIFWNCFWFLKCTFLCFAIQYFLLRLFKGKRWGAVCLGILISQFFPIFQVNWMYPFFATGYILSFCIANIRRHVVITLIVSLTSFIFLFYIFDIRETTTMTEIKRNLIAMNFKIIPTYLSIQLMKYLIGLAGTMSVLSLVIISIPYLENTKLLSWMTKYGKDTLGIYLLQNFILEHFWREFVDLSELDENLFSLIICPLFSLFIMLACIKILNLISQSRVANNIFFGWKI